MKLQRYEEAMDAWQKAAGLLPSDGTSPAMREWRDGPEGGGKVVPLHDPGMVLTLCGMFTHLQGKHDDAMALYDRCARPP
eukprot:1790361-Prymnesium_polylepis.1